MDEQEIDRKDFAARIVALRTERGWNQARLSREARITAAAMSQIEKGDRLPTLSVAAKLAEALSISIDDLIGRPHVQPSVELSELRAMKSRFKWFGSLPKPVQEKIVDLAMAVQSEGNESNH